MPAVELTINDLTPFADIDSAKAAAMIETAMARAARVAPCIRDVSLTEDNAFAAKGVIRDAVLRWHEAGSGAITQQTAGPFSQSINTQVPRRGLFWPSEVDELQAICKAHKGIESSGAFSIDTAPLGPSGTRESWA